MPVSSLVGASLQLPYSNCCWQLQGYFLGLADPPNAQGSCGGSKAGSKGQPHSSLVLQVSRRALKQQMLPQRPCYPPAAILGASTRTGVVVPRCSLPSLPRAHLLSVPVQQSCSHRDKVGTAQGCGPGADTTLFLLSSPRPATATQHLLESGCQAINREVLGEEGGSLLLTLWKREHWSTSALPSSLVLQLLLSSSS